MSPALKAQTYLLGNYAGNPYGPSHAGVPAPRHPLLRDAVAPAERHLTHHLFASPRAAGIVPPVPGQPIRPTRQHSHDPRVVQPDPSSVTAAGVPAVRSLCVPEMEQTQPGVREQLRGVSGSSCAAAVFPWSAATAGVELRRHVWLKVSSLAR